MANVFKKMFVYLGIAEEDDDFEEYAYEDLMDEEPVPRRGLRRVDDDHGERQRSSRGHDRHDRHDRGQAVVRPISTSAGPQARFHLVHPTAFNDAQEVGDKFREGFSVIMNLQTADAELSRRLIDFASGLVYGLGGSMQPVAEKVFLLTPSGVQVSAEEKRRFLEERGFFNQA